MSKKRNFPFGYRMVYGKIEVHTEEALLVHWIFENYLAGTPTPSLAQSATAKGPPYREGAERWNKNMICRILDNQKYLGTQEYPQIIEPELYRKVAVKRASIQGGKLNPALKGVREKLCCAHCGQKLMRSTHHTHNNMVWICQNCGIETANIADKELLDQILMKLNRAITDSERILSPRKNAECLSIESIRLMNEINRKLQDTRVDSEYLLELIKACAQEKYKACSPGQDKWEDYKLKKLFEGCPPLTKFDDQLFQKAVEKVLISPEASVSLELINHTIL